MSNLNDPRYRAAMEANEKLMRDSGEPVKPRSSGMGLLDEMAQTVGFNSIEEMLKACEGAKPVNAHQQRILDAQRTQVTNIILLFGPGHGHTMLLNGPPADEIVWQEAVDPVFYPDDAGPDELLRNKRQGTHMYRLNDEMESAQMEEVAIYTHHERCCEAKMPTTGHTSRPDRYRDMRFKGY